MDFKFSKSSQFVLSADKIWGLNTFNPCYIISLYPTKWNVMTLIREGEGGYFLQHYLCPTWCFRPFASPSLQGQKHQGGVRYTSRLDGWLIIIRAYLAIYLGGTPNQETGTSLPNCLLLENSLYQGLSV